MYRYTFPSRNTGARIGTGIALERHKNDTGRDTRERILAPARRTEAECGFDGHLGSEVVATSDAENTAVCLARGFEGANLCARGWIQNLE